jgi:hypothetical protein
MARRFLIRLRFAPVIGRMFDYLPAAAQGVWILNTATALPVPVAVPRGPLVRTRRRSLLEDLGILCLVGALGYLVGGVAFAVLLAVLFVVMAAIVRLRPPPR